MVRRREGEKKQRVVRKEVGGGGGWGWGVVRRTVEKLCWLLAISLFLTLMEWPFFFFFSLSLGEASPQASTETTRCTSRINVRAIVTSRFERNVGANEVLSTFMSVFKPIIICIFAV